MDERWIATAKRRQPTHRRSAEARERRVYFFSVALTGTPVGDAASREIQNAAAAATTRNIKMPAIIHKFTFVVGRCTFTSGKPLLFLSIDIEPLTARTCVGSRLRRIGAVGRWPIWPAVLHLEAMRPGEVAETRKTLRLIPGLLHKIERSQTELRFLRRQ